MYGKHNKIDRINGLTALSLSVLSCIVTIISSNIITHMVFILWLFSLFIFLGLRRQAIIYMVIYLITLMWLIKLVPLGITFPSPMIIGLIYRFIIPIMAACLTLKIPSGKVTAVFQKLPMSKNIILVLVIMMRFIPTVSGEIGTIREAMKVRGFVGNIGKVIIHPLKTLEYVVVPIIFRSIKIGDELAAASMVRGVDSPGKKESYYSISLNIYDYIVLGVSVLLGIINMVY